MSKTRRINILRYGFILIMALCMSSVFVSANFSPKTAGATSGVTTIKIGDVIKAENYQISHAGGTVTAETMTIVYPSGGVFGGDSFEVKQAGNYQVTYHATVGEQKVEQTEKYLAVRRPQDIIVGEEGMEIGFGKYEIDNLPSGYKINKTVYGAIVNFKMGQSITFGTTIKTEKLTKDYNLLDLIVIPSVFGETDFEKLTMRIADVDNPENYVDVIVLSSNVVDGDGQVSYVKAGANGQQPGGYEGSTYHFGNIYGTQVEHSFRGLGCKNHDRSNVVVSEGRLTLSIDNQEKRVYCDKLFWVCP